MSHFDDPAGPNRLPALVPLPELVPFMEQVSKVARFMTATSEIGTAAVYPELSASIEEGARLIKEYRDKHAKALSELEKQTSEWTNSIDFREAEVGALNQRKDQVELELITKRADLVRLQSNLENSEKLLQDAKSQLELAKADLTSTERQRKDRQAEMTNLQLKEANLRATRAKEELRLQKRATEVETHSKSVQTREEEVKSRETNVNSRETNVNSRETNVNSRETNVKAREEQAETIRADLTRQSRNQAEENSRLDKRRDAIEQLTQRWNAQKEDLKRQQIEVEEARQLSDAMRYDLEGFREKLQTQQINIYADKKALERGQRSMERERETVVKYAKGLEEMVLKEDPTYVPPESNDDRVRTNTIFLALVRKFDDITAQLRKEVREGDRIRLENTYLLEELAQLRRARTEIQAEFEALEGENQLLREQREADDTSLKEMDSTLRLAEDRHRDLIELERKARKRNEVFKKELKDALLERDELKKRLTDIKEHNLRLDDQYNELLCENDTVKKSDRRKGEELKIEQTRCAELRQQVADHLRAQQSANDLVASLQRRYDQICEEVDARKASELEYQKALGEEQTAHAGTKGAYSELDKRIAAADEGTRSAQEELNQLRAQHSSVQEQLTQLTSKHSSAQEELAQLTSKHCSAQQELTQLTSKHSSAQQELTQLTAQHSSAQDQLTAKHSSAQVRVEELQNKVQELTAWKEKTTESLSSLTAVRADKEHLQTENRRLQEERKILTTDLEAKRKRLEALGIQADNQQVLSDAASRRLAAQDRTIDDLQSTITRLRRPRDSEHVAQRERRFMGEFATSRQDDNAEQTRPAYPLSGPSEMGLDDGRLSRPSSPRLPQAKKRRTEPEEVPRRYTQVNNAGKLLGVFVGDQGEEARRTGNLTAIRNGTDDMALPAEVKERLIDQLQYWDGRTRDWASRIQPKNGEVKCCDHVVQRKACQWHSDEEGLLDCYRACPFCAKNRKVCVIVIGEDEILLLPLSDEDRKTYYPGRMSFGKEDVAYWLKSDKQIR